MGLCILPLEVSGSCMEWVVHRGQEPAQSEVCWELQGECGEGGRWGDRLGRHRGHTGGPEGYTEEFAPYTTGDRESAVLRI